MLSFSCGEAVVVFPQLWEGGAPQPFEWQVLSIVDGAKRSIKSCLSLCPSSLNIGHLLVGPPIIIQ